MNEIIHETSLVINEPDDEIFDYLENDDTIGNYVLDEDATTAERIKYELCDVIFSLRDRYDLSNQELAKRLAISELQARQILYHQYDKFTFEELIQYAEKLALSEQAKLATYYHNSVVEQQQYQAVIQ